MKEPKDYIGKWFEVGDTVFHIGSKIESKDMDLMGGRCFRKGGIDFAYTPFGGVMTEALTKELTREQVKERLDKAFEEMTKAMLGEVGE